MTASLLRASAATVRRAMFLLLAITLGTLAGCGTGEYEQRLDVTVQRLKAAANQLRPPMPVPGAPAYTIQLPGACRTALEGADARRMKPGSINLPGTVTVYEVMVEQGDGEQPYYVYVGTVTGQALGTITSNLQNDVKNQLTLDGTWTAKAFPAPNGGAAVTWQVLRAKGKQVFYNLDGDGKETYPSQEGLLDIYLREEGGNIFIIAWRMPQAVENSSQMSRWAPQVAGSLKKK